MNLEQIYKIEDNYLKYAKSVILRLKNLFTKNKFFAKSYFQKKIQMRKKKKKNCC